MPLEAPTITQVASGSAFRAAALACTGGAGSTVTDAAVLCGLRPGCARCSRETEQSECCAAPRNHRRAADVSEKASMALGGEGLPAVDDCRGCVGPRRQRGLVGGGDWTAWVGAAGSGGDVVWGSARRVLICAPQVQTSGQTPRGQADSLEHKRQTCVSPGYSVL